ncbi:helix-turn-helix domain-containing protein [Clostridium pasteurianum]|nr:helix-turn-helix domain-containing protein [Clostridium pasteurianum]UZW16334.1 helix-turn-helix domain-containing protein [Clostridium pasteurianum]
MKGWLVQYRKYGIDGLYPKSRADKGTSEKFQMKPKNLL